MNRGLEFSYRLTVRYVASVSDENPASFFMVEMSREKKVLYRLAVPRVWRTELMPGPNDGSVASGGLKLRPCP